MYKNPKCSVNLCKHWQVIYSFQFKSLTTSIQDQFSNPQEFTLGRTFRGMLAGFWFAFITMTTVGYAHFLKFSIHICSFCTFCSLRNTVKTVANSHTTFVHSSIFFPLIFTLIQYNILSGTETLHLVLLLLKVYQCFGFWLVWYWMVLSLDLLQLLCQHLTSLKKWSSTIRR